jgi:flagellar hook protein FlgE
MPFRLALSGLNAATTDLTVTANNIANVGTAGFKGSRTEFAEMFAVSPQGVASTATGNGVRVSAVTQQFTQGNIDGTGRSLDLAISGEGFFTLSDGGGLLYTRAGAFQTDRDGYVVTSGNQRLQVYPPSASGGFNTGSLTDLRLLAGESAPNASSNVELIMNLPADSAVPTNMPFDPGDTRTYNRATSVTLYDSLGAAHTGTVYFQKTAVGQWNSYLFVDGTAVGTLAADQAGTGTGSVDTTTLTYPSNYTLSVNGNAVAPGAADPAALVAAVQSAVDTASVAGGGSAGDCVVSLDGNNRLVFTNNGGVQLNLAGADAGAVFGGLSTVGPLVAAGEPQPFPLTFNNLGQLVQPVSGQVTFPGYLPATGAEPMDLTLNFGGATQYGSNFGVTSITQDGYTTGELIGMSIDGGGVVEARFTNGRSLVLGQVALANFTNPNGLQQLAGTNWSQTYSSGDALRGQPGSTGFGQIQSGALEASNVDITSQLVNMITAQRNFQANAQMIQTADSITQTVINIR